jgi:hypothetical protein
MTNDKFGAKLIDTRTIVNRTVALGLIAVAAIFGLVLPSTAPAKAAGKSCGRVSVYKVTVFHGSVSCQKARSVIKAYNSGKGTLHKGSGRENWVTTLPGGWSCVSGAGGGEECERGPKVSEYEREDMVGALPG